MFFAQSIGHIIPDSPKSYTFNISAPTVNQPISKTYNVPNVIAPNSGVNSNQQLAQYERDRKQVLLREQALNEIHKDFISEINVNYSFPSFKNDERTGHYYSAFEKLKVMNPNDFSLKEATFIIENAFYENKNSYEDFNKIISNISNFIKEAMSEQNLDPKSDLSKNLSIYQYMTDTLTVGDITHKPYLYDFNDYMGKKNWDNMFVSKLLYKGKGQCNSMPRLYLILAEEIEAESYLAFAPNHSFIRFKGKIGEWHNAELTSGAIMSDIFMLSSGFIKAETVQNGNYMTPLSKAQLMAQLLNDLASGYISQFGRDEFVERIIDNALALSPDDINTNIHKFNMQLARMSYVAEQLQIKRTNELKRYPKALEIFENLAVQDKKLKSLGFEEMPKERYEAWLKSLEKEKEKQESTLLLGGLKKQTIKH